LLVEAKASEFARLTQDLTDEIAGYVIVDLWDLVKQDPDGWAAIESDDKRKNDWVSKKVSKGLCNLIRGDRRVYHNRESVLSFDVADEKDPFVAVENELTLSLVMDRLNPLERRILMAVLQNYGNDVKNEVLAESLGMAYSTFMEKRRVLLDLVLDELSH